jgi:hypothetical protein
MTTNPNEVTKYDGMYNSLGQPNKKTGSWSVFIEEATRSFRIVFLCPKCKMTREWRVSAEDVFYKKMSKWRVVGLEVWKQRRPTKNNPNPPITPFHVEHCLEGFKPRENEPAQSGNFIFLIKRWFDKKELAVATLPKEIIKDTSLLGKWDLKEEAKELLDRYPAKITTWEDIEREGERLF